jgi:hypothetical protein
MLTQTVLVPELSRLGNAVVGSTSEGRMWATRRALQFWRSWRAARVTVLRFYSFDGHSVSLAAYAFEGFSYQISHRIQIFKLLRADSRRTQL